MSTMMIRLSMSPVAAFLLGAIVGAPIPVDADQALGATSVLRESPATGAASGLVFAGDVEAERAYLRTGGNSGATVTTPAAGQQVVFHLDWNVTGNRGPIQLAVRAVRDGQTFCATVATASPGDLVTTFCNAPWTATSGAHTLRWELDYTELIDETDEGNNSATRAWRTGTELDLAAERAFLRTGPNTGAEVLAPVVGQNVYVHLAWRAIGVPSDLAIPLRAAIDGATICSGTLTVGAVDQTSWCNTPWQASAGEHLLVFELDPGDVIAESIESNNLAQHLWVSGAVPSPTIAPSPTGSPTQPSETPIPPTATPPRTSTPTAVVASSPSPTLGSGPFDVFERGDGNCSLATTAADVVAHLAGLGGASLCDNDDCDRDGDVDPDDVACAAGCLFGPCPVPPNAPEVTSVEAVSVPRVRPLSLVRISALGLGDSEVRLGVSIGGRRGEIVGLEGDGALLALVPNVGPGPHPLTVSVGEIASAPFPVDVDPAEPVGAPDSIADVVDDVVALVDAALAFDAESEFGDAAGIVTAELERVRAELPQALLALQEDPAFTQEFEQQLGERIDASGIPELLRDSLAELAASGQAATAVGPNGTIIAQAGRTVIAAGRAVGAAATATAEALGATVEAGAAGAGATVVGTVATAAGVVLVVGVAGAAVIQDAPLPSAVEPFIVEPGEEIVISGANLGGLLDFEPDLVLRNRKGQTVIVPESVAAGEGFLRFEIPDAAGVCGRMDAYLRVPFLGTTSPNSLPVLIRPVLEEATRELVASPAEKRLELRVKGVAGCEDRSEAGYRSMEGSMASAGVINEPQGTPASRNLISYFLPPLVPGLFEASLTTLFEPMLNGRGTAAFAVESSLTDFPFQCPSVLRLGREFYQCAADIPYLGGGNSQILLELHTLEPGGVAPEDIVETSGGTNGRFVDLMPRAPGKISVSAELRRVDGGLDRLIGRARESAIVEVVDDTPPTVALERDPVSPAVVRPGDTIQVIATARDNHSMKEISLAATGPVEAVDEMQTYGCNPLFPLQTSRNCQTSFALRVVASGRDPVVVAATAVDESGNRSAPAELSFALALGDVGGTVYDAASDEPIPGVTVQLLDLGGSVVDEVVSGGGGFFFGDVPAGSYTLRATASGYRSGSETVMLEAGDDLDLAILLQPLNGPGRLRVLVRMRHPDSAATPVAEATVAVLDRDLVAITQGRSGSDGEVLLEGLPAGEYVWLAGAPGLAQAVRRFDVTDSGGLTNQAADLYPANPSCASDLSRFKVTNGRTAFGNLLDFFELDATALFQLRLTQILHHPDAAVVCVDGNPLRPTVGWHRPWANDLSLHPPVDVLRFSAFENVIGSSNTLFNLVSDGEILPPVAYGDASQGRDEGPFGDGTPPNLTPGKPYFITVDSITVTLEFEPR